MAERLIRESDVIKLIDEWLDNYPLPRRVEKGLASHEELLAYIADAPTIEAKPVVHARWKKSDFVPGMLTCTNCGIQRNPKFKLGGGAWNHCPNCGAQMDESISCGHEDDNNAQKTSVDGVKIPVISMEDVPKVMEEMKNE